MLPNGTVLPHGLLGLQNYSASIAAFNQSYRNTGLKAGFVINSYDVDDPNNKSKICQEYDIQTVEQLENKGSTSILYKNCLSSQGFGSIADYLEFTLRPKTFQTQTGFPTFSNQDGAIVLIRCLDNCGDKAIVISNLIHPDRPTNLVGTDPQLFGEYNGVNVQIATDGSFVFTFKGATDSKGTPTDPSQGNTTFQVKTDGSFEFNHSTIDILADRSGALTITTKGDCNIQSQGSMVVNCQDATITASGTATVDGQAVHLGANVTDSVIKGDLFKKYLDQQFTVMTTMGPSGLSITPVPPSNLSDKVKTE